MFHALGSILERFGGALLGYVCARDRLGSALDRLVSALDRLGSAFDRLGSALDRFVILIPRLRRFDERL